MVFGLRLGTLGPPRTPWRLHGIADLRLASDGGAWRAWRLALTVSSCLRLGPVRLPFRDLADVVDREDDPAAVLMERDLSAVRASSQRALRQVFEPEVAEDLGRLRRGENASKAEGTHIGGRHIAMIDSDADHRLISMVTFDGQAERSACCTGSAPMIQRVAAGDPRLLRRACRDLVRGRYRWCHRAWRLPGQGHPGAPLPACLLPLHWEIACGIGVASNPEDTARLWTAVRIRSGK